MASTAEGLIYKDKQHRKDYTDIAAGVSKFEISEKLAEALRRDADRRAYERSLNPGSTT